MADDGLRHLFGLPPHTPRPVEMVLLDEVHYYSGTNGAQVLPALFSDNYVSLMPGESRHIEIRYPTSAAAKGAVTVKLRGWNIAPVAVKAH